MAKYKDLFAFLDNELKDGQGALCDNTLRLTEKFATKNNLSFDRLARIIKESGLYCDCELLLHGPEVILTGDTIGQERFKTVGRYAIEQNLYCRCLIDGKPATFEESAEAERDGAEVEFFVPCQKDDACAEPDCGRATITAV